MFKGSPSLPSNPSVIMKLFEERRKRKLCDCELLKYQTNSSLSVKACLCAKRNVVSRLLNVEISDAAFRKIEEDLVSEILELKLH